MFCCLCNDAQQYNVRLHLLDPVKHQPISNVSVVFSEENGPLVQQLTANDGTVIFQGTSVDFSISIEHDSIYLPYFEMFFNDQKTDFDQHIELTLNESGKTWWTKECTRSTGKLSMESDTTCSKDYSRAAPIGGELALDSLLSIRMDDYYKLSANDEKNYLTFDFLVQDDGKITDLSIVEDLSDANRQYFITLFSTSANYKSASCNGTPVISRNNKKIACKLE